MTEPASPSAEENSMKIVSRDGITVCEEPRCLPVPAMRATQPSARILAH